MADVDPIIEAVFGPLPSGISLEDSIAMGYDVVSCVVLGVAAAAVALRFYVRTMGRASNLGIDDYTVLVGLLSTGALVATTVIAGEYGSGKHVWSTTVPRLMTLLKVVFAEPWVYAAAVTSTKISILLLYRRLFYVGDTKIAENSRPFVITFWTAAFFTCSYPIIMWITMACACRPMSFYWRQYAGATDGKCIDVLLFFLVFGIINMVNDVVILVVPIPRIVRLHMNKRKKVSVAGIMLLGSFVCVASIVRIYYLKRLTIEADVTWILGPAFGWSSLEPSVGIIAACLPTYAPLFRSIRDKSTNSGKGTGSNGYMSGNGTSRRGNQSQAASFMHGQSHFRIEDDEIELTGKKRHMRGNGSQADTMSRNSSENDHGITVKTQIQVRSSGV
ncbi:hypothetical protein BKA67DRAFT_373382 [Truncatella angustata]|uniref:Rhodopsin domain-containing protein n=1 Tax=Truncatella angustata TaxID=152316 RepID=A0A9P8ZTY1_9PEZI|nr:uncharacterized protein BKA67DRAFT_373382 [Truncatella angustata]KAH6648816.1 hypothetical protein BKA67DRAFT_373382 [Truncatella angustata]